MVPLFLLASIMASTSVTATAPGAESTNVRRTDNGEFITRHYPYEALKKGEEGKVSFELTVEPDGALASCQVTQGSGYATLDRETCEFLTKYAKLQPVRNADGRAVQAVQQGYIIWKLPAGARKPAAAPVKSAKLDRFGKPLDMDKTICRKSPRTGSRVGSTKICMTRHEWARSERESREGVEELQGGGGGCPPTTPCRRR